MILVEALKAISHETRLRLMSILTNHELCVCELEDILDERQANISKHLIKLKEVGLVEVRKEKQRAFYGLSSSAKNHDVLLSLLGVLRKEEVLLQQDYARFVQHEQTKDQKIYVCNLMKKEVLS